MLVGMRVSVSRICASRCNKAGINSMDDDHVDKIANFITCPNICIT